MRCLGCLIIYSALLLLCAEKALFFFLLLRLLFSWLGGDFRGRLFCFGFGDDFVLVQARCPCGVRQSLDAAVIEITAAIENHLLDTLRDRAFGNCLADTACGVEITAGAGAQIFLGRRRRHECLALAVVDYLRVDVVQAAIDREPRSLGASFYFAANARVNRGPHFCSISVCHLSNPYPQITLISKIYLCNLWMKSPLFTCLARLQLDRNIRITHALALVSVGLAKLVHLGCDLAQLLLVDAGQRQRRLVLLNTSLRRQTLSLRIDFRREWKLDRM